MKFGQCPVMELPDQSDEHLKATKLVPDFPQPILADSVKGFGQVHEGGVEVDILFLTTAL